jgi:hypothetical protein
MGKGSYRMLGRIFGIDHTLDFLEIQVTMERVAKPLVLQLAGGAKLRPTKAGFGVTFYESANYSSIAEDGERSGAVVQ